MAEKPDYDGSQPLRSGRQELYVQGIIDGKSQTKAYIDAGYKNGKTVRFNACKLQTKSNIQARIGYIRAKIAEMAKVTQEKQSAKLAWAQQHAKENGETSNYIKACEVQNRLYGLDKQVIEQSEAQRQLTETQSAEARRIAEIRAREKAGLTVPHGQKVPQNGTQEPEYALDWTNHTTDEGSKGSGGGQRQDQAGQEQDHPKATKG